MSDFFLLSFESERIFLLHCKIENHILPFICFPSAEVFHAFYVLMLQVEEAIEKRELPAYLEKSNGQISELVRLVRTDLQTGVRIAVEALIVLDVHGKWLSVFLTLKNSLILIPTARDVVKYLADMRVTSIQDFDYVSQLRYYWRTDDSESKRYSLLKIILIIFYVLYVQIMSIGFALPWWLLR